MFLGLGTSALAIVKVPYNISIIMTPICIVLGGIANIWSYHILGDLYVFVISVGIFGLILLL